MSANERTGWRPTNLVNWHCVNNLHCRAAGTQLLLLEYNHAIPTALIEYRRFADGIPHTEHPAYRALCLAAGSLPFIIVYYDTRISFGMCLVAQNLAARECLGSTQLLMSEADYVDWMHQIRGNGHKKRRDFPKGLGRVAPSAAPNNPMTVPRLLMLNGATWVGEEISRRHRQTFWGKEVPAVDLDFFLVDNNTGVPLGLFDYKHHRAQEIDWDHDYSIKAQRAFAIASRLPFRVVRYWENPWQFKVLVPPNAATKNDQWPDVQDEASWLERLQSRRQRLARAA